MLYCEALSYMRCAPESFSFALFCKKGQKSEQGFWGRAQGSTLLVPSEIKQMSKRASTHSWLYCIIPKVDHFLEDEDLSLLFDYHSTLTTFSQVNTKNPLDLVAGAGWATKALRSRLGTQQPGVRWD